MLGFYQDLGKLVPTCRRDPSGLFWIIIELSCIKHNVRSEEENCCDFENAYEYNARRSSMVYQEPLWDVYIPSQSSSSEKIYLVSYWVSREFYILTRPTDEVSIGNAPKDCTKGLALRGSGTERSAVDLSATEPSPHLPCD